MNDSILVSFVIPTYQEVENLTQLVGSIQKHAEKLSFEIWLADNGSTDGTMELARDLGVHSISNPTATIGKLRNEAAARTRGEILVFLDADVRLTQQWEERFAERCSDLLKMPKQVTGARGLPTAGSWVERAWFLPMVKRPMRYIVSSHLITTRHLFNSLGGFDESLVTGEDFEFCQRAKANGASLVIDPKLIVLDTGFPQDVSSFFRREAWHGKGDWQSLKHAFSSSVLFAAALFVSLELVIAAAAVLGSTAALLVCGPTFIAVLALVSFRQRMNAPFYERLQHMLLMAVYLNARVYSLWLCLKSKGDLRHKRQVSAAIDAL